MAHLTDKPLGLVKMQRELKTLQSEYQTAQSYIQSLSEENLRLRKEVEHLHLALSKKRKKV